jgi:hypothetical protein
MEAWETQSGVFFLQHIVIVRLHALLLDSTLDILLPCTCRKWVVGIVLYVHLKATVSITVPEHINVIAQRRAGAELCFHVRQRNCRSLRLRLCDDFNMFEVGKHVKFFHCIFVSVEFPILSRFNASGRAANRQILLECNWNVFRIV